MKTFQNKNDAQLFASVNEFKEIYESRPIQDNSGGMDFGHSWATWHILTMIQPALVIESGLWRGHSTWLIQQACPKSKIVCFEPNLSRVEYKLESAEYYSHDFSQHDWTTYKTKNSLCFFDDHQNSYSRLMQMKWFGFTQAIFEDNPKPGDGDFYSINHVLSSVGASSLQMNKKYKGNLFHQCKRILKEIIIKRLGHNQNLLVPPNTADRANMMLNVEKIIDIESWKYLSEDPQIDRKIRENDVVYVRLKNNDKYGLISKRH